ncbi:hypothetical protein M885DRAFT_442754, partial [Pelagophyceae sp. CCMP2097]
MIDWLLCSTAAPSTSTRWTRRAVRPNDAPSPPSRNVGSLLQWASINGRASIVDALLQRGASAHFHGGVLDETAMQWAVRHGHLRPVVSLREAGCDAAHAGVEGANAVHLACRHAHFLPLAYLLARDEVERDGEVGASGLLELLDERGRTPLM